MNWCLIKHKWEYKTEDISFFNITRLKSNVTMPTKVRLCTRCYKKQRSVGIREYWVDWDLTKEEEREIKLKEIGI